MLTDQEALRLSLGVWRSLLKDVPDEMLLVILEPSSGQYMLNKKTDGRCVFLGDDNLCIVHKEAGAEAKPTACRWFPTQAVQAPDGVHLSVNTGCRRLIEVGPGDPSLDQGEAARLLANAEAIVTLGDEIPLTPDRMIAYSEFLDRQQALIACLSDSDEVIWTRLAKAARLLLDIEIENTTVPPDLRWQSLYADLERLLVGLSGRRHSLEALAARSRGWLPSLTRSEAALGGQEPVEGSTAFLAWIARQYLEGQQAALHRTARSGWVALLAAMVAALLGTAEIAARGDLRPDHALNSVLSDALDLFFNTIGQIALTEPNQQALLLALAEMV